MYVAKWNFFTSGITVQTTSFLGSTGDSKCLTFSYAYTADTSYPARYGLFCPLIGLLGTSAATSYFNIVGYYFYEIKQFLRNSAIFKKLRIFMKFSNFYEIQQFLRNSTIFTKFSNFYEIQQFLRNSAIFKKFNNFYEIQQFYKI